MNTAAFLTTDRQRETLASLKTLVPQKFYEITYTADYKLDTAISGNFVTVEDFNRFAAEHLLDGAKIAALKGIGAGCAVFTGRNAAKEPLFCRNYDYGHDMSGLLVHVQPENGYRSVGMCDLGFIGIGAGALEDGKTDLSPLMLAPYLTVDGINEKGFAVAALQLDHPGIRQNTGKVKINTTTAFRMMLDHAADVYEALELLRGYDMQSPLSDGDFHFMMLDAKGVSKCVEYINGEMHVLDALYCENAYLTLYMGDAPESPRFNLLKNYVIHRRDRFEMDDAFSLLRCASQDKDAGVGRSYTRWSAVMNTALAEMTLYYDRDYAKAFTFQTRI